MKCYICGNEFPDELTVCPVCGTRYGIDLQKAIDNPVERYRGLRTDGFEPPKSLERRHDPQQAALLLHEGLRLAREQDYAGAEEKLRDAAAFDENNVEILFYWGSCLFKMDRFLEARGHWAKAARIEPGNERIKRWLKKVEDLLNQDF